MPHEAADFTRIQQKIAQLEKRLESGNRQVSEILKYRDQLLEATNLLSASASASKPRPERSPELLDHLARMHETANSGLLTLVEACAGDAGSEDVETALDQVVDDMRLLIALLGTK